MNHTYNLSTVKFFLSIFVVLTVIFVLSQQTMAQDSSSSLYGKTWTLTEMAGRSFSGDKPNIAFDRDSKRVSGSGGCNRFGGTFAVDRSMMKLSRIFSTKMACVDAEVQRVESSFLQLLETTTRFEVQQNRLRLYAGSRSVLVFVDRAADSQSGTSDTADLGGTSWQLVKFRGRDNRTLTPDDKTKYTLKFGNDGRLSARIDCNRGSGRWKSDGPNQLRLGQLALTRAMCPPGSLHNRIVKDSGAVRSYLIQDGHLFLSLMANGGSYEFEPIDGSAEGLHEGHVTGTITYRQRIALTPSAVLEVRLFDVSRADAGSVATAEQTIKLAGRQVPIAFDVVYDPQRINPGGRYAIEARIRDRNRLLFQSSDLYLVITAGHPNKVHVVVKPVPQ